MFIRWDHQPHHTVLCPKSVGLSDVGSDSNGHNSNSTQNHRPHGPADSPAPCPELSHFAGSWHDVASPEVETTRSFAGISAV